MQQEEAAANARMMDMQREKEKLQRDLIRKQEQSNRELRMLMEQSRHDQREMDFLKETLTNCRLMN